MQKYTRGILLLLSFLAIGSQATAQRPVKVFILAGQSNMQGHGETVKGDQGNLTWLVKNDQEAKYRHLVDEDGNWKKREDVFVYAWDKFENVHTGGLSIGYGAFEHTIGPELQFGHVMGDHYENDVLLIKTAWGGKSLAVDFCPPGAVSPSGYKRIPYAPKDTGYYYVQMLATIHEVLNDLAKYVPDYKGQGYELAGFGWHQGWNDRANASANAAYENNLKQLIRDVRRDLGAPGLPFVIATTGMKGWKDTLPHALSLMKAQLAIRDDAEFQENVSVIDTRDFWRDPEDSPSGQVYHWCRNAESYFLIGQSMAEATLRLIAENEKAHKFPRVRPARGPDDRVLTPTPPMGWNSWNAFEKDIDEEKIKAIADIMVSSGMRDVGYEYLVLDDAWMADARNAQGELVADSTKFPGGMKALGDYIHSKGLKYGIYQCRGYLTCQKLPGSFEHEQTDMSTFARWGVDYIKLDACYAAKNGRLTTEDLAIYRDAIHATGRPMILSISDFGNGAWAWGGKNYGQLWRTSGDIFPFIKSVYRCGETSGGAGSSHPAFNGLWQFAGPDQWNDPDMLQVGNLAQVAEDKAHFSLWCILAAPLMAGNDLRSMPAEIETILTAPEVIAVNQDTRALQGYKIYQSDSTEIYNKPLADGTTAVLLLNKGEKAVDLTVKWKQLGLRGRQSVRDLWEREDLGTFKGSFTAKGLAQHEHMLIRVGTPGSKPLPGPSPVPAEKYTVMKRGTTYLSDLYYIMKEFNPPVMNKSFQGAKLAINGTSYKKGLGCKSRSVLMYKINRKADRLQAVVGLDEASPEDGTGRFRVLVEDKFGGRPIFDSGQMSKNDAGKVIDIDVSGLDFILLEFTGRRVFGNWADIKVVSKD